MLKNPTKWFMDGPFVVCMRVMKYLCENLVFSLTIILKHFIKVISTQHRLSTLMQFIEVVLFPSWCQNDLNYK